MKKPSPENLLLITILVLTMLFVSTLPIKYDSAIILKIGQPYNGASQNNGAIQYRILTLSNNLNMTVSCDYYKVGDTFKYTSNYLSDYFLHYPNGIPDVKGC